MFALILVSFTVLFIFIYISLIYLPLIAIKNEKDGVLIAREKLKLLSKGILKVLDVQLKVRYRDKAKIDNLDKKKGIIYICNHQSNLDIPVVMVALTMDIGFVAKIEMSSWPFFSTWMKKSKCVFLNRKNPREGIKSIKEGVELIKNGYPIVIFPEGERNSTGEIGEFKKGSFKLATETNGVIVPLTIKGSYNIQKKGEWKMKRHQEVEVIIDTPIYVDKLSKEDKKNLSTKVRSIILKNYSKKLF